MEPITTFSAKLAPLPSNDIDTDQIVPARFLKVTDRSQLAGGLFADWRTNPDGTPKEDFVLNNPDYADATILIGGSNFGCGSSREHAPWVLLAEGFRAVISTDFADIFRNNSLKNGLIPIAIPADVHQALLSESLENPQATVTVNLEAQTLTLPNGADVSFPIDSFAKHCLLNGVDDLGFLLGIESEIAGYESSRPQPVNTLQPGT